MSDSAGRLIDVYLPAVVNADPSATTGSNLVNPHWQYGYDPAGNETTQTDPKGNVTTFAFDQNGNQVGRTMPDNSTATPEQEKSTYDAHQRLATHTDFKGQVTGYVYDDDASLPTAERKNLGRLVYKNYYTSSSATTAGQSVHYTYDSMGRKHTVTDDSGTTTYAYDAQGHQTQAATPEGTINYTYDAATGRHTDTYTNHTKTSFGYDSQGRLTTVTVSKVNGTTLSTPLVTTDTYDVAGNKISETLPNGNVTAYTYDIVNRLTTETIYHVSGSTTTHIAEYDYTLLSNDLRQQVIEKNWNAAGTSFSQTKISWEYDSEQRLTKETRDEGNDAVVNGGDYIDTFSFDLSSNRMKKVHDAAGTSNDATTTYAYNGDDELLAQGADANSDGVPDASTATTSVYDANGSQTTATTGSNVTTYGYDLRNKMTSVAKNSTTPATYVYDDQQNRVRETAAGATTFYLIDTRNPSGYSKPVEQKSSAMATPTVSFILGQRAIGQIDSGGAVLYLLADGRGNTRGLSTSNSVVTATLNYDAYNNAIDFNPATIGTNFQASDGMYDSASGLTFHSTGRPSDNSRGRFVIKDDQIYVVSSNPVTVNLYLLDNADPINGSDPSGHMTAGDTAGSAAIGAGADAGGGGMAMAGLHAAEEAVGEIEAAMLEQSAAINSELGTVSETFKDVAQVTQNRTIGRVFQDYVLKQLGIAGENFQTFTTSIIRNGASLVRSVIPDAIEDAIYEVKNVGYLYLSSQLQAMMQVAVEEGLPFVLVVAERTDIADTLRRAIDEIGGRIIVM